MTDEMVNLGSLIQIRGGKRLPAGKALQQSPSSHPYIRVRDVGTRRLPSTGLEYVPDEVFPTISRYIVNTNDVVISIVGTIGALSLVDERYEKASLTENCARLTGLDEDDALYLYYYLASQYGQVEIHKGTVGAVQPKLPLYNIEKIQIRWPENKDERTHIAHILGTLDDKIELNRRMNETLEAIARAIFKSWFVDFDPVRAKASGEPPESICCRLGLTPDLLALFPDRLVDSELGEIPEGWVIRTMADLSLKVGMGPFGSNIKVSTFVEHGVPVISGQHLKGTMLEDNTYKFVTFEHADRLASSNVGQGDVVFTHAGNIGQVSYIPDHSRYERYVLSQRQFYLRCDLSKISPLLITYFFRSPLGQHKLLANASQVGVPSIARPVSYLKTIELATPPKALSDKFDELIRVFQYRISTSLSEINTLADLRDSLLPKLLSGELQVSEADPNIEVCA